VFSVSSGKTVCCLRSVNLLFEFLLKLRHPRLFYLMERMNSFKAYVSTYSKDEENTVLLSWAEV